MVLKRDLPDQGRLLVALVLLAVGCALFSRREHVPPFSHVAHTAAGATCDGCHEDYEYGAYAGMPTYEMCLACHGPMSDRAPYPYEVEIQKHAPEERWQPQGEYRDLKFAHVIHNEAGVDCESCHGDVGTSEAVRRRHLSSAPICVGCHETWSLAGDCSTCHQTIRKDAAPRTHGGTAWRRTHGRYPMDGYGDRGHAENCTLCHTQASCDRCHRWERPEDHTEYFRIRGHGAYVSLDRDRCMVCHQESYCIRCHSEMAPRSHYSGSWGGLRSNHCLQCHPELSDSGCSVCHRSTPSHSQAPPIPPPPHPPASSDCYQCHLTPPHADNGMPCTSCHR